MYWALRNCSIIADISFSPHNEVKGATGLKMSPAHVVNVPSEGAHL